jgi:hypothetical protein
MNFIEHITLPNIIMYGIHQLPQFFFFFDSLIDVTIVIKQKNKIGARTNSIQTMTNQRKMSLVFSLVNLRLSRSS